MTGLTDKVQFFLQFTLKRADCPEQVGIPHALSAGETQKRGQQFPLPDSSRPFSQNSPNIPVKVVSRSFRIYWTALTQFTLLNSSVPILNGISGPGFCSDVASCRQTLQNRCIRSTAFMRPARYTQNDHSLQRTPCGVPSDRIARAVMFKRLGRFVSEQSCFVRVFFSEIQSTGALLPSSRYVAQALTSPLREAGKPIRVLEVGPGTGSVTSQIVQLLQPGDQFDLVELNPSFVQHLRRRFDQEAAFRQVANISHLHEMPLEAFHSDQPYDIIISGLPFNNFTAAQVESWLTQFERLLAPHGVLSYFEYQHVRRIRGIVAGRQERKRLSELEQLFRAHFPGRHFRRDTILCNVPPAWVQHLRKRSDDAEAAAVPSPN